MEIKEVIISNLAEGYGHYVLLDPVAQIRIAECGRHKNLGKLLTDIDFDNNYGRDIGAIDVSGNGRYMLCYDNNNSPLLYFIALRAGDYEVATTYSLAVDATRAKGYHQVM